MPRFIILLFLTFMVSIPNYAQSVLNDGEWFKVQIEERGIYKLSYSYLKSAGLDVDNIDPTTIKLYGLPGGMLPQSNEVERPDDLVELSIMVEGEDDGQFGAEDYVLFYAEDGDTFEFKDGEFKYEHNIYSDENYYFLTHGGSAGKRVEIATEISGEYPQISTFNDFKYFKEEKFNLLTSGRKWYSERFSTTTTQIYLFPFENIVAQSDVKISVNVMAQAFELSSFEVSANGSNLGTIEVQSVPDFTQRINRYRIKGYESKGVFLSTYNDSNNEVEVSIDYLKNPTQSTGYLNDITVEVISDLILTGDELTFRSTNSIANPISTFAIQNAKANTLIWDVTNHSSPEILNTSNSNSVLKFNTSTSSIKEFIAFNSSINKEPSGIEPTANQNLKGILGSEFIIISHPLFMSEANRLAAFRSQNDGLNSTVVNINHVYNEFSSGRQDVSAIRDYAKFLFKNGSLKYLLLFGKGSYDYKDVIPNNTNYLPIYESRNSLHPLDTYASDDYFGFLEDDEGDWLEINGGNHTLDIGVGRLPIKNENEARLVVDKIINYTTKDETIGNWRNNIVFVADDGDFNLHQRQANELSVFVDTTYSAFQSEKFFLDNFPQISKPSGEVSPAASESLDGIIEEGALIVNFTGHGGESGWMQEQVLDLIQIQNWRNIDRLPLFVTATCEFSRHDDPDQVSGGELVVTSEKGGGIAIVSTCRPVSSASNFVLNKAFYEAVYLQENGEYLRLGDIFRITKNNSVNLAQDGNRVGNRNFALLGDPTLRLSYPSKNIEIISINDNELKTDTLKAQGRVRLKGQINSMDGTPDNGFNGKVLYTIFDKQIFKTTLGNESSPFTYLDTENIIFKGASMVTNGLFDIEFIVPKNISYQVGNGKINMYAFNDKNEDANGSDINLKIGDTAPNPPSDQEGPEIILNIGDTLNTNLQGVSHNTNLVAILSDESGINLSSFGIGNDITITIDDETTFKANVYYRAFENDFTRGYLSFPLNDLTKGPHTARVKVWDTNNNSSEAEISFTVADPNEVVIYKLENYPNPFSSSTNFRFTHNRSGEDLVVTFTIISPQAGEIFTTTLEVEDSSSDVELLEWEGVNGFGQNIMPGIYIYRIDVRSIRDGVNSQAYQKLILIN